MAINFPDSPVTNDTYTVDGLTWVYNGTAWKGQGLAIPGVYTTSETAPLDPIVGSAWMNTTDGRLYIWNGYSWFEPSMNMAGPSGATGATGPTGPTGPAPSVGKIIAISLVFGG